MRLSHQPPAQSLPAWLDAATRDLVPSAQARIRAEIEAHFAEAVQSRLATGARESEANATALTDLGDPNTAARRFHEKYLTRMDLHRLQLMIKGDDIWQLAALKVFGLLMFACMLCSAFSKSTLLMDRLLLGLAVLCMLFWIAKNIAIFVLAKRNASSVILRQVLLLRLISNFVWLTLFFVPVGWFIASWSWIMLHAKPDTLDWLNLAQLALCGYFVFNDTRDCLYFLRLRKKLLMAGEVWNEPPPGRPSIA